MGPEAKRLHFSMTRSRQSVDMTTTTEAEVDNKVKILRDSFGQYQGILIDIEN